MSLPLTYNIRNVCIRWRASLLAVLGITLVVAVFVVLIAMQTGFARVLGSTGIHENAIVTQKGGNSELTSVVPREQLDALKVDSRVQRDESGVPLASPEMVFVANLPHRHDLTPTNVLVRGVTSMAFQVRASIQIVAGRSFQSGIDEIIVGRSIQQRIAGLDLGATVKIQKRDWKVVGVFSSGGSGFESELWMDVTVLSQAFNRKELYQSLTLRLADPSTLQSLSEMVSSDPKTQVEVKEERAYYTDQAGDMATRLLALAYFVSGIMAVGAIFGGMNTMYAIVASRTREIGTLRALGFSRASILISFLVESVFLALAGGILGCLLALPANSLEAATGNVSFSELAFAFQVTPQALGYGLVFALVMGALGGFLPALRAARLPIATALKAA